MKTIKIPKGEVKLEFENGHGFVLTAKQIWDALTEYVFSQMDSKEPEVTETKNEKIYDDEFTDSITGTEDGI